MTIQPITSSDYIEKLSQSNTNAKASELLQDFQNILLLTTLSSLSLGGSSSNTSSLFGGNLDLLTSLSGSGGTSMNALMEQLMAMQVQGDPISGMNSSPASAVVQINQFAAEKQVGGDGVNSNCGPSSLVMALHRLGIPVAGETSGTNSGELVDLARKSMAVNSSYDGVDSRGRRVEAEHNVYTDFEDLAHGASEAGARSKMINANSSSIRKALQAGSSVIISGTFLGKSSLPWTGDRGSDNESAPGNAGNHIVLVSKYDASTGLFTVNDPARLTPKLVTSDGLEGFLEGNAGAIAISK